MQEGGTLSGLQEGDIDTQELLSAEGSSDKVDPSRTSLFPLLQNRNLHFNSCLKSCVESSLSKSVECGFPNW